MVWPIFIRLLQVGPHATPRGAQLIDDLQVVGGRDHRAPFGHLAAGAGGARIVEEDLKTRSVSGPLNGRLCEAS